MIPSNKLDIQLYLHCAQCLAETPPGSSPKDHARLEVGWTMKGVQVWCNRHNCNVVNIDFQGATHPANTTREETP